MGSGKWEMEKADDTHTHTHIARPRFLAAILRCICHGHNPFPHLLPHLAPHPTAPRPHLFNFTLSAHNEICV